MDSVRFGRVLGLGARMAAKTLVGAVDAATSPNPSQKAVAPGMAAVGDGRIGAAGTEARDETAQARVRAAEAGASVAAGARTRAARVTVQARKTGSGLQRGTQRFGEAVWGPTVRLSGVLWLEVTGVFFGLFAVSAAAGAWKIHAAGTDAGSRTHMLVALGLAVVFGYFCVSSFVRARRRERSR